MMFRGMRTNLRANPTACHFVHADCPCTCTSWPMAIVFTAICERRGGIGGTTWNWLALAQTTGGALARVSASRPPLQFDGFVYSMPNTTRSREPLRQADYDHSITTRCPGSRDSMVPAPAACACTSYLPNENQPFFAGFASSTFSSCLTGTVSWLLRLRPGYSM